MIKNCRHTGTQRGFFLKALVRIDDVEFFILQRNLLNLKELLLHIPKNKGSCALIIRMWSIQNDSFVQIIHNFEGVFEGIMVLDLEYFRKLHIMMGVPTNGLVEEFDGNDITGQIGHI
jgi:hypothetical protein